MVTILGVLGVGFAVFQYMQTQEAGRAKETLAMIEIWETRGYSKSFKDLGGQVQAFLKAAPKEDLELASRNDVAAQNLRGAMYERLLSSPDASENFDRAVYFFNRLGLCVEANLCSVTTAEIFFQDSLRGFMSNFLDLIHERRSALPSYANGILLLSEKFQE